MSISEHMTLKWSESHREFLGHVDATLSVRGRMYTGQADMTLKARAEEQMKRELRAALLGADIADVLARIAIGLRSATYAGVQIDPALEAMDELRRRLA